MDEPPAELVGGGPAGVVEGTGEKNEVGFDVAGVPKPEKGDAPLGAAVLDPWPGVVGAPAWFIPAFAVVF